MPDVDYSVVKVNTPFISFPIADFQHTKLQMLNWLNRFSICCFLDNQQYNSSYHHFECLAAAGAVQTLSATAGNAFNQLQRVYQQSPGWWFGHFSFDLKNELESLQSQHPDGIGFPDLFFFQPQIIVQLSGQEMRINAPDPQQVFEEIMHTVPATGASHPTLTIQHRFSRQAYTNAIRALQQHIARGDCYVINFCQEFYSAGTAIDPATVYRALSHTSPNPFAAFYKVEGRYLLCASPERYLRKTGNRLISQPIKGTAPRNTFNARNDDQNRQALFNSPKERSENVMVVDLVRNDLSKVCEEGTVTVEELFGIYSFPQVHQMISTITGRLSPAYTVLDAIKATFPMGSMTGAPKKRVLQLIEAYEQTRRGLYSGSVGYFTPEGDFDFNVVIRSILYNEHTQYLSFQTGAAITFYSDPEQEYEECLLKAAAIKKVLAG